MTGDARGSKRLAMLEKLTAGGAGDAFAWYALALEYKSLERFDDAVKTFEALRGREPGYVPMYLMCGTMLAGRGDSDGARRWLEEGVSRATEKGDTHALSELRDALAGL